MMPANYSRTDEEVQRVVGLLLRGAAPEREEEVRQYWSRYMPLFEMTQDTHEGERFILDAGAYRTIRFNHRVARAFWLGGFAAWESYVAVTSRDGDSVDVARLTQLTDAMWKVIESDDPENEPLPPGVPEPGPVSDDPEHVQEKAAAELATIGLAWAFLHELRHIQHQQDGTSSADRSGPEARAEELNCDEFATRFLFEKVADYTAETGDELPQVQQKRAIGVAFALFTLALLTESRWLESDSHPSCQQRVKQAVRHMGPLPLQAREVIVAMFDGLKTYNSEAPAIVLEDFI
jgi:hypothetical protein